MPKHTTITKAAADRFKAKNGRVDHFDSSYPGLALRVSDTGRKAWTYFYRLNNGKVIQRRMTLGVYPAMSVQQAHKAWREAFELVQAGRDPMAVSESSPPAMSFESVFEEWLKRDQAGNRSAGRIERRIRVNVLPAWQHRLITDIDRRACLAAIDTIADRGKVILARRVFSHLHRMFVWCIGRGILEVNPLQHAEKPGAETRRDRVLNDREIVKLWGAAAALRPYYRDAFRLLLLTGARKQEISELRWDEIKDGAIHLVGERTKTDKPHLIPLSSAARRILDQVERSGDYVFRTDTGRPSTNWSRAKKTLDEASGVTGWIIHDLRRTAATGLQKLGTPLTVTEAILGHTAGSRGGIVGVYQRHDYAAEKASALEAWGARVIDLVEGCESGTVVPMWVRQ
jgi:integrase